MILFDDINGVISFIFNLNDYLKRLQLFDLGLRKSVIMDVALILSSHSCSLGENRSIEISKPCLLMYKEAP